MNIDLDIDDVLDEFTTDQLLDAIDTEDIISYCQRSDIHINTLTNPEDISGGIMEYAEILKKFLKAYSHKTVLVKDDIIDIVKELIPFMKLPG